MIALKCKMCGGDVEISPDTTYGKCAFCGSKCTFPKIDDQQRTGLFNRGNALRMQGEFDRAAAVFERIIEQDITDAEAHWCLALCRYGIEYVESPKTGERKPTCHRASYDSILNDADYRAAVKNADSHTAELYTAEAERIAKIQKDILVISKREEPYDVFICYKEKTGGGSRTKESVLAQDIYYELHNMGYKVFFSRITLEAKLGTEYEPYIFAALGSAKVMLVVGTSAENFNSAWVKNEWRRFLTLMKNDRNRVLIPCYRDMDLCDLPDELSALQSQNMSKLGFMQDITRGVKKIVDADTTIKTPQKSEPEAGSNLSLERLIQNGETFLKLNNYADARKTYSRLSEEYPEEHRGWWGLIVCATMGFTKTDVPEPIHTWFGYVRQLADKSAFKRLENEYIAYTRKSADRDAELEIAAISREIESLNTHAEWLEEKLFGIMKNRDERIAAQNDQIAQYDQRLTQLESRFARRKADNKKVILSSCGFFIIALLLGIFLTPSSGHEETGFLLEVILVILSSIIVLASAFLVISVLSFVYVSVSAKKYSVRRRSGRFQTDKDKYIHQINIGIQTARDQAEADMEAVKSEKADVEKRLAACRAYLDHGKSKISDMFLAKRCLEFGSEFPFDSETERHREAFGRTGADEPE